MIKRSKKHYKFNIKKLLKNIVIITLILLFIKYIKLINSYNNILLNNVEAFTTEAKKQGIDLTSANYSEFLKNK